MTTFALLLLKLLAISALPGMAWFLFRVAPRRPLLWLAIPPALATLLLVLGFAFLVLPCWSLTQFPFS